MEARQPRSEVDQRGFTLIELMVVVLIIAILLAIAIPTFLGARTKANDRAAQSSVRNAHVVELVVYADKQMFTEDVTELGAVDSSITYTQDPAAMSANGRVVYVDLLPYTTVPNDTVLVEGKSASGSCFWIRTTGGTNQLRFADNDCSVIPAAASYRDEW